MPASTVPLLMDGAQAAHVIVSESASIAVLKLRHIGVRLGFEAGDLASLLIEQLLQQAERRFPGSSLPFRFLQLRDQRLLAALGPGHGLAAPLPGEEGGRIGQRQHEPDDELDLGEAHSASSLDFLRRSLMIHRAAAPASVTPMTMAVVFDGKGSQPTVSRICQ